MAEKKKEEKLSDALLKVALGYQVAEITEEYAEIDGELKLTKRKKTKKDVPPDLKAVQMLLSTGEGTEYSGWSDEELEAEKKRLLETLEKQEKSEEKSKVKVKKATGRSATKRKKTSSATKKRVKKEEGKNEG